MQLDYNNLLILLCQMRISLFLIFRSVYAENGIDATERSLMTSNDSTTIDEKRKLRAAVRARRGAIAHELRRDKSEAVSALLCRLFGIGDACLDARETLCDATARAMGGRDAQPHDEFATNAPESPASIVFADSADVDVVFPLESGMTVAVYRAFPDEADPAPFVRCCYASGVHVAFPCMNEKEVDDDPMYMRLVSAEQYETGSAPFVRNPLARFGRDDRRAADFPIADPSRIDAVVVPLVAFDDGCRRLGYGGGNYDAFIARLADTTPLIGAAFAEQRIERIPTEPHDRKLTGIVYA